MTDVLQHDERPDAAGTPAEAARPLRADARRNRERILQAARAVFAEDGAEAQIDDVAARAGVGVGTVYRHFPTKDALLAELVRERFGSFTANGRAALERGGAPFDVLCDWLRANAAALAADAAMQQAVSRADGQMTDTAAAEQAALLGVTEQLLARARADGSVRPDATADDVGMLMCGLCATMGHPGFDWHRHLALGIDALRAR